ncbi:element excision factor XisH family protein [Okeania sp. SIO3I5]
MGAEKDGQTIAVEIKSFLSMSFLAEFHTALGQFLNYSNPKYSSSLT